MECFCLRGYLFACIVRRGEKDVQHAEDEAAAVSAEFYRDGVRLGRYL